MIQMILFAKLKYNHRHREQMYGQMCVSEVKSLSRVQLFATPWTAAYQAPPPKEFWWDAIAFSA